MFKYFPTNYVWNLSIGLAIEMGAKIGEIEEMCGPLQEAAKAPDAEGAQAFREAWERMANKLCELAAEDEAKGRLFSASDKLARASGYLQTAERLQVHGAPARKELFKRAIDTFWRSIALAKENCERVEIPYEHAHIAGLFVRAQGVDGPAPILVQINGLDSAKEMNYRVGMPQELARRGVSSLIIDQPGTGEALRLHGLTAVYDTERWASKVVDWLIANRPDVDPKRIGLYGLSLGGYYCPRAVAFEPRFALGVVLGANHDWREVQKQRMQRASNLPVPGYWEHARWVWGAKDQDEFMKMAENIHLDGILDRINVPFLVTHGEKDSQIALSWAHRTYDQLVNSPKRELKIFTDREGGVQHCSFDNPSFPNAYIADWVAETFGGKVG